MKTLAAFFAIFGLMVVVPVSAIASPVVSFQGSLVGDACKDVALSGGDSSICDAKSRDESVDKYLKNIINFMLMLVGILAVIMIIVSGIRYATSAGDSSKVTSAKNTLLYSVIGLAVALLSFAIVNFVMDQVDDPGLPASSPSTPSPSSPPDSLTPSSQESEAPTTGRQPAGANYGLDTAE